jgi:hypothetical protein
MLGCKRAEGDLGTARVVHVEEAESGLRFLQPGNPRVQTYVARAESFWAHARLVEHARNCCIYGPPVEPSLPRLRTLN